MTTTATPTTTATRLDAAQIARVLGQPEPTEEQRDVIEAPLSPLLVVAGAGSGKTETMAARVVYLVANGMVSAEQVLGLTFTRKAAAELAQRVRARLRALRARVSLPTDSPDEQPPAGVPLDVDRPTIATYNSFAGSIARDHALRIGTDPDARLLTEAGAWQLADDLVQSWSADLEIDRSPGSVTEAVLALANAVGEHLLTPAEAVLALANAVGEHLLTPAEAREQIEQIAQELTEAEAEGRQKKPYADVLKVVEALTVRARLMDVVEAYVRRKRESGLMDFADQVALAARIAREVPEVGAQLREQYRVVLLDEYQDTSVAQLELLSNIFGHGHPVTAVGDPHQAIYGWRGASAAALASFPARFPTVETPAQAVGPGTAGSGTAGPEQQRHPGTRTLYLSTSWRNDVAVLQAANTVAGPLRAAQAEEARSGASVAVPVLQPRPGAGQGEVLGLYADTAASEARAVAEFLAARWQPDSGSTAAVLCRTRAQFTPVVTALREAGLPVVVLGLGGLLATPEVVDLRSTLQAAHDPSRGDALMRLLTGLRLGAADLHALQDWARHLARQAAGEVTTDPERQLDAREESSLVEAVDRPPAPGWTSPQGHTFTPAAAQRVRTLTTLLRHVRQLTYLPLPELVVATEQLLGLDIEVSARAGAGRTARASLDAFAEVAAGFAGDAEIPTLGAFLSWLDAAEAHERGLDAVDAEADPSAVQVLTVHAAKGLEWDVVAVPGMVESQFPSYDGRPSPDGSVNAAGWLTSLRELPYPLRGDAESLPRLDLSACLTHNDVRAACAQLRADGGTHRVAEERRLAYVALTRARHTLLMSGSWFRGGKTPLPPSRFLREPLKAGQVRDAGEQAWAAQPEEGAENPALTEVVEASWPQDPLGPRRGQLERAARAVREAHVSGTVEAAALADVADPTAQRWLRDAELLLAERAERAAQEQQVPLGGHLSASGMVNLLTDPRAFARDRRRPVPTEPTVVSRRGTRFHEWVEQFYGAASLLDVEDLPGGLTPAETRDLPDAELRRLQETFGASEWAVRTPVAVEVDLETPVAGTLVRCRIDAVFDDAHGTEVVDWKTGRPPSNAEELGEREMQLALYRLAWSRATGTPLERVGAAFYYVGHDRTVRAGSLSEQEIVERITSALRRSGG